MSLDFQIDHAVNVFVRHHPLLASIVAGFADWGVLVFGAAAVLLWFLAPPGGPDVWKRAGTAGLAGAALALALNQVVIHLWQRPRPYASHPHAIVPLLARSGDPSFPSDHASAAFGIAVGILLVRRRAGLVFLLGAALIAVSRVATGLHYPTDVLAGAAIGSVSGFVAARAVARQPLAGAIRAISAVSDPVVAFVRRRGAVRRTLLDPRVRAVAVAAVGVVLLVRFAADLKPHLLDELPLAALAAWVALTAMGVRLARLRYDDARDHRTA